MTTAHDAAISVVARLTLCTPPMVAMGHYEPIIGLFQTDAAGRHFATTLVAQTNIFVPNRSCHGNKNYSQNKRKE